MKLRIVALLVALVMFATACSSGSSDQSNAGGEDSESAESAENGPSPLEAALGFDFSDPDAFKEQQRDTELAIKECMNSQGFDYELSALWDSQIFEDSASMSEEEFAATHGYGIAADALNFATQDMSEDPNMEMMSNMSETESEAWSSALYGSPDDEPDEEAADFGLPGGCYGDAISESMSGVAILDELGPQLEELGQQFEADPRVIEIQTEWSECMAEKGYSFAKIAEPNEVFYEKVDVVMEGAMEEMGPDDTSVPEEVQQALEEIRTEEIETAKADLECVGSNMQELEEIQREYEVRFVEENKAVFEGAGS